MKKVLILTRKDDRPEYDQKSTYQQALARLETKCDYRVEEFEDLLFVYDGVELKVLLADGRTNLSSFDSVFFTGWFKTKVLEDVALSVSLYLEAKKVQCINTEALFTRSRSKLSQYVYAALNDISVTPFIFSLSPNVLRDALTSQWSFGYPIIMKGILANRGDDNYLVNDRANAEERIRIIGQEDGPWLIVQKFIPNDGDYRIIVMGEKVSTVIHRRTTSQSHLNNTSKGGEATTISSSSLPDAVIAQSITLAHLLRREITGVDMIQHRETGEYFLLEINNMPQLATGKYVDEKIKALDNYFATLTNR